jgi:hypothetical protein
MYDEPPAVLAIERAMGASYGANPLRVFVDGALIGRIWRNGNIAFSIPPGKHAVSVKMSYASAGPLYLQIGSGERVDLFCRSNQLPINPLMLHAIKVIAFLVVCALIAAVVPQLQHFLMADMETEVAIAGGLSLLGALLYVVSAYKAGALWLEIELSEKTV